jgi:hypothetical protein
MPTSSFSASDAASEKTTITMAVMATANNTVDVRIVDNPAELQHYRIQKGFLTKL